MEVLFIRSRLLCWCLLCQSVGSEKSCASNTWLQWRGIHPTLYHPQNIKTKHDEINFVFFKVFYSLVFILFWCSSLLATHMFNAQPLLTVAYLHKSKLFTSCCSLYIHTELSQNTSTIMSTAETLAEVGSTVMYSPTFHAVLFLLLNTTRQSNQCYIHECYKNGANSCNIWTIHTYNRSGGLALSHTPTLVVQLQRMPEGESWSVVSTDNLKFGPFVITMTLSAPLPNSAWQPLLIVLWVSLSGPPPHPPERCKYPFPSENVWFRPSCHQGVTQSLCNQEPQSVCSLYRFFFLINNKTHRLPYHSASFAELCYAHTQLLLHILSVQKKQQ